MDAFVIGLYGLYLVLVGAKGNTGKLMEKAQADAPAFMPWLISLGVLAALYENDTTKPVAKPFLFLAILSFVLINFDTLKAQVSSLYNSATSTGAQS